MRKLAGVEWEGFTWDVQIVATNVVYPFDKFGYSTGNQIVQVLDSKKRNLKQHSCVELTIPATQTTSPSSRF